METKNGKNAVNGKVNGQLDSETKKEIAGQQAGAEKAAANSKAKKGKKGKALAFAPKPIPEAVKGVAEAIEKVTDLENLKALARVMKRHFRKVYEGACKKAAEGLKAGNVVYFKHSSKLITGKVVKVKSTGRVKIEAEGGKTWRVPGTLVHKGKPIGADRAEVTKKAA